MSLPAGVSGVTVTSGKPLCLPDGTPVEGKILFTGPDVVTVSGQQVLLGGTTEVTLDGGQFSVTLAAPDTVGMDPSGWPYQVTAAFSNAPGWIRHLALTKSVPAVALGDLVVADPSAGQYTTLVDPSSLLAKAANLADVLSAATARSNLGLGSSAVRDVGTVAGTVAAGDTLLDQPGDQGLLAWTYDPTQAGHVTAQSSGGVAGRITLTRILLRKPTTVTNLWFGLSGVDTGATLSNCYLGLYDTTGALKGVTADLSSQLVIAGNAKSLSFPLTSPVTLAPGVYYVALLLNGTWTTNSFTLKCSGAGVSVNAGLSAPALRYANLLTAQTSLPSTLNMASQTTTIITTGWGSQWYGIS